MALLTVFGFRRPGVHLHNGLWSALMSGMAATGLAGIGIITGSNDPAWWQHYRAIAGYFNNIPITRSNRDETTQCGFQPTRRFRSSSSCLLFQQSALAGDGTAQR